MKAALLSLLFLLGTRTIHAGEVPLDTPASSLKFTGHAFLHDFHGEAKVFNGHAEVDLALPEAIRSASLDIAAAKMTTFVDARDRNMENWLHADANPDIQFELTKVKLLQGDAAGASKAQPARFAVTGSFRLNKIARPLFTEVTGWREGQELIVTGTAKINTPDYGLPEIRQFFMTVDPQVDIEFRLVFDLPPELRAK